MGQQITIDIAKALLNTFPRVYLRSDCGKGTSVHFHKAMLKGVSGDKLIIQPFGHGHLETVECSTVNLWTASMRNLATELNLDLDQCLAPQQDIKSSKNTSAGFFNAPVTNQSYILINGKLNQVYTSSGTWSGNPNHGARLTLIQAIDLWEKLNEQPGDDDFLYAPVDQAFMYIGEKMPIYTHTQPDVQVQVNVSQPKSSHELASVFEIVHSLDTTLKALAAALDALRKYLAPPKLPTSEIESKPKTPERYVLVRRQAARMTTQMDLALQCICDKGLVPMTATQIQACLVSHHNIKLSTSHVGIIMSQAKKKGFVKITGKEGKANLYGLNETSAHFRDRYVKVAPVSK